MIVTFAGFKENNLPEESLQKMFLVKDQKGEEIPAKTVKYRGKYYLKLYPSLKQRDLFDSLKPKILPLEITPNPSVVSMDKIIMPEDSENETTLSPQKDEIQVSKTSALEKYKSQFFGTAVGSSFKVVGLTVKYTAVFISTVAITNARSIFMFS